MIIIPLLKMLPFSKNNPSFVVGVHKFTFLSCGVFDEHTLSGKFWQVSEHILT